MNQSVIAEALFSFANGSTCSDTPDYPYFQQQDPQAFGHSEKVSIILFFSIIAALLLSFVVYFWIMECHKVSPQRRRQVKLEISKEMDQLIENFKWQVATCVKLPVVALAVVLWKAAVGRQHGYGRRLDGSRHYVNDHGVPSSTAPGTQRGFSLRQQKVLKHKYHHLVSLIFLGVFVVSIFVLLSTLWRSPTSFTTIILEAAVFAFVLCINLFLVTRQHFYYMKRKEFFGRDHPQMLALSKTRFYDWDRRMWGNWVQIAILFIEFFQLLGFPLRDMLAATSVNFDDLAASQSPTACSTIASTNTSVDVPQFQKLVNEVINVGGLIPDMRSPTWYRYTLWSTFIVVCASLAIALMVHGLNRLRPYMISVRWVHWFVPIVTTFVSSAACQSLNVGTDTAVATLRCHGADIGQQEYLWVSLIGYAVAYVMMTTFLTSYERVPQDGEIAFKTMGVAFIKNMGARHTTFLFLCFSRAVDQKVFTHTRTRMSKVVQHIN
ncbi:hypothetical protein BC938DRAFT_475291 [Jimgerdemannia flammicorona]|uniref:Uncharacterized protein n=1 Tax=Jimgerdemannia flammicorona TaxID=994334 RepID=A0A433PWU8_9FUNG|nr:hypothetical protein BC938DRAFT_475291 [Jimgerdemannia flammicorona]